MSRRNLSVPFKAILLATTLSVTGLAAPAAFAEKYASIVIDTGTDEVLHARHADEPRYPASLTKVMTLYMLFDAINAGEIAMDDKLTVSRFAAAQAPSSLRLKAGSKITVSDAIDALVTKSANDVAVVVAERIGGTEKRFAQLMTVKAKSLGLANTRFVNASGLPDKRQISTARDMSKLAEALIDNHGDSYHYFSQTRFKWGSKTYKSHNALLGKVAGVDGIKTGYTRASGFNLMTSAERDGNRIVAIMLGGNTAKARNTHVEALVEAAFTSLSNETPSGLRHRQAFASIDKPLHPDAAAVPMLNGKPLPQHTAQGASSSSPVETQVAKTQVQPVAKPVTRRIVQAAPKVTRAPAEVKVQAQAKLQMVPKTAPVVTSYTRVEPTPAPAAPQIIAETPATPAPAVKQQPAFSVAEYEAKQIANAK
jgi:D-alanyl-D-alanine carboxypeptidase